MILEIRDLCAGYGTATILRGVTLEVRPGRSLCLLGRNGAGKSTLVKSVLNLIHRSQGEVVVCGEAIGRRPTYRIVRPDVGYAPQDMAVFRELTVEENLTIACKGRKISKRRIGEAIEHFPVLSQRMGQRAGSLSGGEQKMLIFARAILGGPPLVVLDEVSEGVQPSVIKTFSGVIDAMAREHGMTFLIVEQHVSFGLSAAVDYAVIESGGIVEQGAVGEDTEERVHRYLAL